MKPMNPLTATSTNPVTTRPTHRASLRRTARFASILGWVCGGCVALLAADNSPVTTNLPPAEALPAKSVFVDDPEGKDPFFPNSTRRFAKQAEVVRPVLKAGPQSVRLGGIVGDQERPVALINNLGFMAGEERKVRVPGGREQFTLRCVEIRQNSVIVTIDGGVEQFEIHMAEFGLPLNPETR